MYAARSAQAWLESNDLEVKMAIVWTGALSEDSKEAAKLASMAMKRDPRLTHFWDPNKRMALNWEVATRENGDPITWDVALFFSAGAVWPDVGGAPVPRTWCTQYAFLGIRGPIDPENPPESTGIFVSTDEQRFESDWFREISKGMKGLPACSGCMPTTGE